MKEPDLPPNESERLEALRDLGVLDTPPDPELDAIVRVAAHVARAPIALVSLVDSDRQWFKARVGLDAEQTGRAESFCGHAVASGERLVVRDARADPRFADNPLVTGPPHVVMYSGAPLRNESGEHVLGTLCVIDSVPRDLTDEALRALDDLARTAELLLRRRREERLRREAHERQQHLAAIVTSTDDAYISTDRDGRIRSWNRGAETIFGGQEADRLGSSIADVTDHDPRVQAALTQVLAGETAARLVVTQRRDGEEFVAAIKPAPIWRDDEVIGASLHVRDITDRQRAADERDRLAAVLELTPDAVAIVSAEGTPVYANLAMRSWVGHRGDSPLPTSWKDVHPPWAQARLQREALPALREHGTWTGETAYLGADGREIPALQVLVAWRGGSGELDLIASVAHDIRERKNLERLKDEFISTVSHELRTPLTSIRGALGLLAQGGVAPASDKGMELLRIASNNSKRLVHLVNDLLDFEKLAAGRVSLSPSTVAVRRLVDETVRELRPLLDSLDVTVAVEGDVDALVHADPRRVPQVLANLLSNAAKFSPAGDAVTVVLTRTADLVRVEVRDRGPGVPSEFVPSLFERFSQADGSSRRKLNGTGLGLSIAKGLVELHGGEVGYRQGEPGAIFWFTLPSGGTREESGPVAVHSPARPAGRVLIVEDDPDIARLLALLLEREGLETTHAGSLAEARDAWAAETFDAVTLDAGLPDGEGIELLQHLRSSPGDRGVPVVVVSASATENPTNIHALDLVDWIQKPIDEGRLLTSLRAAIGPRDKQRILHVDDDEDVVRVLSAQLAPTVEVERAGSLAEARAALRSGGPFALVVLDLGLPDGDGIELLDELRAAPDGGPPVVLLSARADSGDHARRVEACLTKSKVDESEFARVVESALRRAVSRGPDAPAR